MALPLDRPLSRTSLWAEFSGLITVSHTESKARNGTYSVALLWGVPSGGTLWIATGAYPQLVNHLG